MLIFYIYKFLRVWGVFASVTLLFSVLISLTCNNIFKVMGKNKMQGYIPVYNLFNLLDIVNLNRMCFILLVLPLSNILMIYIILYRISIIFHTNKTFSVGLLVMPVIFLPMLNFSDKLDIRPKKEVEEEELKKSSINLMTNEELKELNNSQSEEIKVDNVFKRSAVVKEEVPTFKANKIKYDEMLLNDSNEHKKEVDKLEISDINKKDIVDEDDNIEIVEL